MDDNYASVMSGEEEEELSEAVETAENFRREGWTNVEQLRRDEGTAMERQDAADISSMGHGLVPPMSTCMSIFRRLKPIEHVHFGPTSQVGHISYQVTCQQLSTKRQAPLARDRILVPQTKAAAGHSFL